MLAYFISQKMNLLLKDQKRNLRKHSFKKNLSEKIDNYFEDFMFKKMDGNTFFQEMIQNINYYFKRLKLEVSG